jgi:transcriptional regulator with GAF, ATPase, and Fis domain
MEASGKVIEPAGVVLDDLELSDESEFTVPEPHEGFEMRVFLSGIRRRLILRAIEKSGGNLAAAARLLGCSRQVLSQEMAQEKLTDDNQTLQKSQVS